MNITTFNDLSRSLALLLLSIAISPVLQATTIDDKPSVVTSIRPLGLIAKEVAGDYARVSILTDGNTSAHHYQLSVSDRRQLVDAHLVLWVGEGLEAFLTKPMGSRQRAKTHRALITASILPGIEEVSSSGHHDHHDEHQHGVSDPHIWLNPANNRIIIDELVSQLSTIAPHYAQYYKAQGSKLKQALTQLDKRLSNQMATLKQRSFIVAHPAYNHFISRYQLSQIDYVALIPEQKAGAKHLYHLRQQQSARCVFEDLGAPSNAARQLAKHLDIPISTLDPLGIKANSVVELIQKIGVELQQCLAEQK